MFHLLTTLLVGFSVRLFAASEVPDNRDPKVGKVHVQNHTQVDKAPFFLLNPFRVIVLNDKRPCAIFRMDVMLETHDTDTKAILETHLRKIYSALFEDFYGVAHLLWGAGYTPDLMAFKKRAEGVVRKIVGPALVKDVLIQRALFKPLKAV